MCQIGLVVRMRGTYAKAGYSSSDHVVITIAWGVGRPDCWNVTHPGSSSSRTR
jgi:hypothetical protein